MGKDILYPMRWVHGMIHDEVERQKLKKYYLNQFKMKQKNNPKTVFLVLTPEHGNLGDHAIAMAEIRMLQSIGVDYVEITGRQLSMLRVQRLLSLMNGKPILVNGGGNLGSLWLDVEHLQRDIMKQNPKSPIIILPNTIFYGNTESEQQEFRDSIEIYNVHRNLHLYAREQKSYDIMSQAYNHVKLIPDMVLSLNQCGVHHNRKGCILCLRGDCEKTRTDVEEQMLRDQITDLFGSNVKDADMIVEGPILPEQRDKALQKQFDLFSGAELVVTDRLHGMIFCAITGTPCIVINSKSPKVRGCYEWIKNLDYIKFADDVSQITEAYKSIPKTEHHYDNSHLQHYYDELSNDILEIMNWK